MISTSLHSMRSIRSIPFPRGAIVRRKRLAPNRIFRIRFIPKKKHDHIDSLVLILAIELAYISFERSHNRRIQNTYVTISPIDAPQPRLGIEEAKRYTLETLAINGRSVDVHIANAMEQFFHLHSRLKRNP